jgi:hypothetical protein
VKLLNLIFYKVKGNNSVCLRACTICYRQVHRSAEPFLFQPILMNFFLKSSVWNYLNVVHCMPKYFFFFLALTVSKIQGDQNRGPTLKIYEFFVLSPKGFFFLQTLYEICYLCFSNRFYLALISLREPRFILMGWRMIEYELCMNIRWMIQAQVSF